MPFFVNLLRREDCCSIFSNRKVGEWKDLLLVVILLMSLLFGEHVNNEVYWNKKN